MLNRSVVLVTVAVALLGLASWAGAQGRGGKKVKQTAVIALEKGGEIRLEFFPEDAPKTVENFVTLSDRKSVV